MDSKLILSASCLVLLALIPAGSDAIKCHQCSSYKDADCADPFFFPDQPEVPKTNQYLQECKDDSDPTKEFFCRKIYQNVRGDERVIRSCGWERDEKRDCYATVLEEYNTYVCQCDKDGCNSASMFSVSSLAVMSTLVLAYLMQ